MTPDLKVYWRPGCSSCVKVKEYLTQQGVPFESIDVAARPEAMKDLLAFGVKTVPVVARGSEFVFAQALEDVSRFIGRKFASRRLPPQELVEKWLAVLRAAQRHVRQLPATRLSERAVHSRDRSIRDLAYHVYQVPDAFLQAVENGLEDLTTTYNAPPPANVVSTKDIQRYGESVTTRVERWWSQLPDKSCRQKVKTYYGERSLHELLERCTWHSAQHARQIASVLERLQVKPDGPLSAKDYAGLPMPQGLWE
jgi:glutaredoxin/uncharacterized damage-inducible protein DinB